MRDTQEKCAPGDSAAGGDLANAEFLGAARPGSLSHFVTGLIAARPAPGGRYTLRNLELAVHDTNGGTDRRRLATPGALRAVLEDHFQLTLPHDPGIEQRLSLL